MKFTDRYTRAFTYLLPSPFTIAILLTAIIFCIAFVYNYDSNQSNFHSIQNLFEHWEQGLWNNALMVFAMQMMLMLVLGHVLALTPLVSKLIDAVISYANNTSKAAFLVTILTISVSLFNWGLGLIFGAIICRKIGERASKLGLEINYPLVGAAGYSGLMVWHGGISGSSLIKVAEEGHLKSLMKGIFDEEQISSLPLNISLNETAFSAMNILNSILILLLLPLLMYFLGILSFQKKDLSPLLNSQKETEDLISRPIGAERIDNSSVINVLICLTVLMFLLIKVFNSDQLKDFSFITPNFINLTLFALAIGLHQNFKGFLQAVNEAIGGASGILIQFPLYFGIMGVMKGSGLVEAMSQFFIGISNETTFPIFTLISAGIVNVFVPSGGGQWAVQGPIIIQAAEALKVSLPKSILALAYGDQLTNMLQPFWALPLLGITKLSAKEILPYTLILMLAGILIYITSLLIF